MFIELHLIQNFAPSNLNRDDTGNPKDTDFGGVRRARISSQALKRAIRHEKVFEDKTGVKPSIRTKLIIDGLLERMNVTDDEKENAKEVAIEFAKVYSSQKGRMDEKKPEKTAILLFMARQEFDELAAQLAKLPWAEIVAEIKSLDSKKIKPEVRVKKSPLYPIVKEWIKKTKHRTSAPDIALFGRMLADRPETNIDAACQVAHAISTHRVNMDMDYFTAVDDLQTDEETGASMIGVTAFNSACFYRYARIDFNQLVKNLDGNTDLAKKTVEGFLRAALRAIPTGKQNAFAAQNPPDFALAVVRKDGMSWSLANAFEKPVRTAPDGGFVKTSIEALDQYWDKLSKIYGNEGLQTCMLNLEEDAALNALAGSEKDSEKDWLECILSALNAQEA